jgi:hypothetical protein
VTKPGTERDGGPADVVRLLAADPDLAEVLAEDELEAARLELIATGAALRRGPWTPGEMFEPGTRHLGLLVTQGVLCREVAIGGGTSAELVGPGDLIRPWEARAGFLVTHEVSWHVLDDSVLAILDERLTRALARWPALTTALVERAVRRSHSLTVTAAINRTTGLESRLLMLFGHLADRWGRVRPDGVLVPVRLTHELIARMVGARRPSVSTALKQLERKGSMVPLHSGGWLLTCDPPRALPEERAVSAA